MPPKKVKYMQKKMTKVNDMLRESRDLAAKKIETGDMIQKFNMEVEGFATTNDIIFSNMDERSKHYITRLYELRQQQRVLLPLFIDTQKKIAKHKKCLQTIIAENGGSIPIQLQLTIEKG